MKTKQYSTEEAAKQADISFVTLRRWVASGKFRPSVSVPLKGHTLWKWTDRDIERLKKYKAVRGGRWPKGTTGKTSKTAKGGRNVKGEK
jgi:ribosomal protein S13